MSIKIIQKYIELNWHGDCSLCFARIFRSKFTYWEI